MFVVYLQDRQQVSEDQKSLLPNKDQSETPNVYDKIEDDLKEAKAKINKVFDQKKTDETRKSGALTTLKKKTTIGSKWKIAQKTLMTIKFTKMMQKKHEVKHE